MPVEQCLGPRREVSSSAHVCHIIQNVMKSSMSMIPCFFEFPGCLKSRVFNRRADVRCSSHYHGASHQRHPRIREQRKTDMPDGPLWSLYALNILLHWTKSAFFCRVSRLFIYISIMILKLVAFQFCNMPELLLRQRSSIWQGALFSTVR